MKRIDELGILIKDTKWWINLYADELKSSTTHKPLRQLKEKIEQLDLYLKEMDSLK